MYRVYVDGELEYLSAPYEEALQLAADVVKYTDARVRIRKAGVGEVIVDYGRDLLDIASGLGMIIEETMRCPLKAYAVGMATGILLAAYVLFAPSALAETSSEEVTRHLTSGDTAYEDAYVAGAVDAFQDPDQTIATIYTICGERGGQTAEDLSCVMNPKQYWGNATN